MGCNIFLLVLAFTTAGVNAECISPKDDPDGAALCPASYDESRRLNGKAPSGTTLKMYVRPTFAMWAGLDFAGGFAKGAFVTEQVWDASVDNYFSASDASSVVRIANFNGGTSGEVAQPIVKLSPPAGKGGRRLATGDLYEVRRQFEGRFKQAFNAKCFPFDHQEVSFDISMDKPISSYFEMFLLCEDGQIAKDVNGNVLTTQKGKRDDVASCTKELSSVAVGMKWDSLVCTRKSSSQIMCTMNGHRSIARIVLNFLLPSLMVCIMSFASFLLHVSMAMPRIATTVIAMLTLINLRNALSRGLPGSGALSWIEEYFSFAIFFMFFNLCCHVASMMANKRNLHELSDFIDDTGSGVSFSMFLILPFLMIASSGCTDEGISLGAAVGVVVVGVVLLFYVVIKSFVTKRAHLMTWIASRKAPPSAPPSA